MSMNPEQQNFEDLRRLIAMKRYEQPPPGYFNRFSGEVLVRIRAGDKGEYGESILVRWFEGGIRWQARIWEAVQTRPALAGAFGLVVCGALVSGVALFDDSPAASVAVLPVSSSDPNPGVQLASEQPVTSSFTTQSTGDAPSGALGVATTEIQGSLFEELRRSQAEPRAFLTSFEK